MVAAVKVDVSSNVLKLFVPVHWLLNDDLTNDWLFKVVKLTSWVDHDAVKVDVGSDVLKLFVPVHTLLKLGLTND